MATPKMRYNILDQSGKLRGMTDDKNAAMRQASFYRGSVVDKRSGRTLEATSHSKVFMSNPEFHNTHVYHDGSGWIVETFVDDDTGVEEATRILRKDGGRVDSHLAGYEYPPTWVKAWFTSKKKAEQAANHLLDSADRLHINPEPTCMCREPGCPECDLLDYENDSALAPFVEGAAFAFWADAFMTEVDVLREEDPDRADEFDPGPGGRWEDVLPETPEEAEVDAEQLALQMMLDNKVTSMEALRKKGGIKKKDLEDFGYYSAMQAVGHGVGWEDLYPPHGLALPHVETGLDTRDAARSHMEE